MNKRQTKKHIRKATILAIVSFDIADRYLDRYRVSVNNYKKCDGTNEKECRFWYIGDTVPSSLLDDFYKVTMNKKQYKRLCKKIEEEFNKNFYKYKSRQSTSYIMNNEIWRILNNERDI